MTEQAGRAKVGDVAKDFVLKDQNDKEFKLSEHKGERVLLSFHPMAWTGVCAAQMKSLEANKETFDSLNTVAVGLSVDSAPSKKAWADTLGIRNTSLLADFWPHGGVAKLYGLFREKSGIAERSNVLVDENGKIVFVKVYPISELPDIKEIIDFLKNLKG
jgi:peroxiredoxin